MELTIIRTTNEWDALASEWDALLKESARDVPFLRHAYLRVWWAHLGGGEWAQAELYIVLARTADGSLAGIAPLFLAENREGVQALLLLGSIEISDYLDVIARPDDLPAFLAALLVHLSGPEAPAWAVLDWYNIPESSPALPALKSLAQARGWGYQAEPYEPSPAVSLPGDWDLYLAGLKKKQRHEIRRKIRRAENAEAPVRWYIVDDPATLDAEVAAFFELMANDPAKAAFLTAAMRAQMRAIVQVAAQEGWLQLAFLEVGGEKAAAYLNFDYGNHIYLYNSGIDMRFRQLSVGWVLLSYLIRWANEHGREVFDFLRGSEAYKYRFGGVGENVMRIRIVTSNK